MFEIKYKSTRSLPAGDKFAGLVAKAMEKIVKAEAKRQMDLIGTGKNSAGQRMTPAYSDRYYRQKVKRGKAEGRGKINLEYSGRLRRAIKSLRVRAALSGREVKFTIDVRDRVARELIKKIHSFQFNSKAAGWKEERHFWGFGFQPAGKARRAKLRASMLAVIRSAMHVAPRTVSAG